MTDFESKLLLKSSEFRDSRQKLRRGLEKFSSRLNVCSHNVDVLADEGQRVVKLASHSYEEIKNIDDKFCRITGLDTCDLKFLAIATALQTARWIIIDWLTDFGARSERDNRSDHDDKTIKRTEQDSTDSVTDILEDKYPRIQSDVIRSRTWQQILDEPVPFDVLDGSADFDLGMSGKNHREMTLGHDPILGWFFGTINILTDTTTIKNCRTFIMSRLPKLHFSSETFFLYAMKEAYRSIREDKKRLVAAIAKEAIHLKSDFFTKAGLPIPIIPTVLPDLSSKLYKEGYDALCLSKDIGIVAMQAFVANFINVVVAQLHGYLYFFDREKFCKRELFEVKTRKILLYSNMLAENSNVIASAVRCFTGDVTGWKHLDWGGLIVCLWRIITDLDFIYSIREEFLQEESKSIVVGDYEKRLWKITED